MRGRITSKETKQYMKELAAKYSAAQVEDKWYQYWLEHKCFHSEPNEKEP